MSSPFQKQFCNRSPLRQDLSKYKNENKVSTGEEDPINRQFVTGGIKADKTMRVKLFKVNNDGTTTMISRKAKMSASLNEVKTRERILSDKKAVRKAARMARRHKIVK